MRINDRCWAERARYTKFGLFSEQRWSKCIRKWANEVRPFRVNFFYLRFRAKASVKIKLTVASLQIHFGNVKRRSINETKDGRKVGQNRKLKQKLGLKIKTIRDKWCRTNLAHIYVLEVSWAQAFTERVAYVEYEMEKYFVGNISNLHFTKLLIGKKYCNFPLIKHLIWMGWVQLLGFTKKLRASDHNWWKVHDYTIYWRKQYWRRCLKISDVLEQLHVS